jgi:hypothetical protein
MTTQALLRLEVFAIVNSPFSKKTTKRKVAEDNHLPDKCGLPQGCWPSWPPNDHQPWAG